jgi:hypothetical protein
MRELASSTARTLTQWRHQPCYWHSIQWFYSFVMVSCHSISRIYYLLIIPTGTILFPRQILIKRAFDLLTTRYRYHQSHVSRMRLDRLNRLHQANVFTVFVLGPDNESIPICKHFPCISLNLASILKILLLSCHG